jgi:hypothetical protein
MTREAATFFGLAREMPQCKGKCKEDGGHDPFSDFLPSVGTTLSICLGQND